MLRNFSLIIILILGSASCLSPNLLNKKLYIPKLKHLKDKPKAVILDFSFVSENHPKRNYKKSPYYGSFIQAIENSLYNSGKFSAVEYSESKSTNSLEPGVVALKINLESREDGEILLYCAFPAIYPMPIIWPIQPKTGLVSAKMNVKLYHQGQLIEVFNLSLNEKYSMIFYGPFRNGPIEDTAVQTYEKLLMKLSNELSKINLGIIFNKVNLKGIKNIAVLDLERIGRSLSWVETRVISDKVRIELLKKGYVNVLERSKMKSILKEQAFQQTGCITNDCAVRVGQLIGVTHLIAGSVSRVRKTYYMNLRLIDIEKGKIIKYVDTEEMGNLRKFLKNSIPEIVSKIFE